MALSGSFYTNIGSGYRLQMEWSATQSISSNTSTITAKLYLISLSSYYYINSSTSRNATITINGDKDTVSTTAKLSANQKKLLMTKSYTTGHNADGTKTSGISGTFDLGGISLSGKDYGTVSVSQTVTLNTIPRKSTITSDLNWRPPRALPVSISRASSSFKHDIKLYVKRKSSSSWTYIKTWADIDTYSGGGFTVNEMKSVYTTLSQEAGGDFRLILETFNGGSSLGTNTYDGSLAVEYSSRLDADSDADWNIGEAKYIGVARNHWDYTHIFKFYVNNVLIHTSPTVEYSYSWTPTSTESDNMFKQTINSNSVGTKIEIITYYEGVQVDIVKNSTGTGRVVNSNPTFGKGYTYADTNSTTTAITGSNQYVIQNKSNVKVTLTTSAKAVAKNWATMKTYTATLGGKSVTQNWSDTATVTFDFGTINATTDQTLSVKAVDSRGNSTTTTKTVTIVPYSPPVVNTTVKRLNGFEAQTTITLKGSYASLTVAGTTKNALTNISGQTSPAQYRYKDDTTGTWTSWKNFGTATATTPNYNYPDSTENLDNAKSFTFEVRVNDKLGMTTITKNVAKGKPIFFIDSNLNSVGINTLPVRSNAVEVEGDLLMKTGKISALNPNNSSAEVYLSWLNDIARIRVGGTGAGAVNGFQIQGTGDTMLIGASNDGTVNVKRLEVATNLYNSGGGGLDMNNSDIIGANGIWFNDTADSGVEGLNFLKSGKSPGSTSGSDYDSLRARDGALLFNDVDIANFSVAPTVPSMSNSWEPYFGLAYAKTSEGMVFLRGMMRNGSLGNVCFTLPSGCRPNTNQVFYVTNSKYVPLRLDIETNGNVTIFQRVIDGSGQSNEWICLNGVYFTTV